MIPSVVEQDTANIPEQGANGRQGRTPPGETFAWKSLDDFDQGVVDTVQFWESWPEGWYPLRYRRRLEMDDLRNTVKKSKWHDNSGAKYSA